MSGSAVTGVSEVVRALDGFGRDVEDLPVLADLAQDAAAASSAAARRKTGRMAAGVSGSTTRGRAVVSASALHSGVQNYGWTARGITPNNFLQAGDGVLEDAPRRLEADIDRSIRHRGLT